MRVGKGDGVKEERTCWAESGILTVKTEHKSIAFERRERQTREKLCEEVKFRKIITAAPRAHTSATTWRS